MAVTDMQKLQYTVFDALVNFYRRRSVNLIVAVSFSLGLLLPILCLGNINIFVENLSTMRYKDDANVWLASFEGADISAKEISALLKGIPLEVSDYAVSAYKSGTVEVNGVKSNEFVNYLTKDGAAFENFGRIDGSLELPPGTNICLIEQGFAEEHGGLRAGSRLKLFGAEYTVGGIFSSFHYYGKILLSLPDGGQAAEPGIMISTLYLRTKEAVPDGGQMADLLKNAGLPVSDVRSGVERYRSELREGLCRSTAIFGVGFAAFAFAAINIFLVLSGKFSLDRRAYGIRMALGAPHGFIFLSAAIENMLCFCMAYLLDIAMVHILKPTYPEGLTMILNARVYAAAYVFGALMTAAVTWAALHRLKNKN